MPADRRASGRPRSRSDWRHSSVNLLRQPTARVGMPRLAGHNGPMPQEPESLKAIVRPAAATADGALVLMHGRGTSEHDLAGLFDLLDPEARLYCAAPRAPLQIPGQPGNHWYVVERVGYPE